MCLTCLTDQKSQQGREDWEMKRGVEEKEEAWTAPARLVSVTTTDPATMTLGHSKLGLWFLTFAQG